MSPCRLIKFPSNTVKIKLSAKWRKFSASRVAMADEVFAVTLPRQRMMRKAESRRWLLPKLPRQREREREGESVWEREGERERGGEKEREREREREQSLPNLPVPLSHALGVRRPDVLLYDLLPPPPASAMTFEDHLMAHCRAKGHFHPLIHSVNDLRMQCDLQSQPRKKLWTFLILARSGSSSGPPPSPSETSGVDDASIEPAK